MSSKPERIDDCQWPNTTAAETYGPHMGCIWATYGDLFCNIWSFFNIWGRKSFRKHNIWATYGSLFQTYGVLLKHIGPFWNIWGLSETYGAFRERSLFLFPTCHIALFRYMSFFFSQKFCQSQIRPVPDISAEEKRLLEVSGRAWNLFSTIKAGTGKPPLKFQVDLATAFLPDRMRTTPTTPRLWPGPCLVLWAPPRPLEERAHAEVQNVRRPQRLKQENHVETWASTFLDEFKCLRCMHAASWRRSIDGDFDHEGDTVVSFSAG